MPPSPTSAFQKVHETSLPAFKWGSTKPQIMHDFALFMAAHREDEEFWLKVLTPKEIIGLLDAEDETTDYYLSI